MKERLVPLSKYLALQLRHDPNRIGLQVDAAGWADIDDLIQKATADGFPILRDDLFETVQTNDKGRYELDATRGRVRARQGHSIVVDVGLEPKVPPSTLYHGTAESSAGSILAEGLRPMGRQHVHLAVDVPTAVAVGRRHGRPRIFAIDAGGLSSAGEMFYVSRNKVWLVASVPPEWLTAIDVPEVQQVPPRGNRPHPSDGMAGGAVDF